MIAFRLAPEAEAELDEIWIQYANATGSAESATRIVEGIAEGFWLLARFPYLGRARDEELRPGLRSWVSGEYVIIHRINGMVLILHVLHGRRDLPPLFTK